MILTFLIVEDEPQNRLLLRTILGYLGHVACEASDGLEAIALLDERPNFDAVLLDMAMAPVDGFAVLKRVRERPETRRLPVICVSAHARPEDQERALQAGADAYLVKPFRRSDLIAVLDAVLVQGGRLLPGQTVAPS